MHIRELDSHLGKRTDIFCLSFGYSLSPLSYSKGESQFSVLPFPLSFARSRECKCCPNSGFDRGVG